MDYTLCYTGICGLCLIQAFNKYIFAGGIRQEFKSHCYIINEGFVPSHLSNANKAAKNNGAPSVRERERKSMN